MNTSLPIFAFFGSSRFSVIVLDELEKAGLIPTLIVTTPDRPQGRKMLLTPTPVKNWAVKRNIPVLDPERLDEDFIKNLKIKILTCDVFIVASYGKIIPENILNLPSHKSINIHPSLLPKYRGASPLQSAILDDAKNTGVTIIRMDDEVDHGPIIGQRKVVISEWPTYDEFEDRMAREGASLLIEILPDWIAGKITEREQNHSAATFTKKIGKEDAVIQTMPAGKEIIFRGEPYEIFRKIQAYHTWPHAHFMHDIGRKSIRVKITAASFTDRALKIERVIPEGSREMTYSDFIRGYKK